MDYRVALDIYKGPLDLLLYLIQESEVDIYDIPIAKVTDQYVRHLEIIRMLDPNIAGDFLVMAATLMEIKSRMLLPRPERAEDEEDDGDPRIELIRQLMEYKKFKEAAAMLGEKREEQMERFSRAARQKFEGLEDEEQELEMSEVSVWDILSAFDRVMRETLRLAPATITDRDVPVRQHIETVLRMLRAQGTITFLAIFETCEDRIEAIGTLLALLEMARAGVIGLAQTTVGSEITIKLLNVANIPKLLNEVTEHYLSPEDIAKTGEAPEAPAEEPEEPEEPAGEPSAPGTPAEPAETTPEVALTEPAEPAETPPEVAETVEDDEEEPDEDIEEIRRIEIHDVDLRDDPADSTESNVEPADAPGEESEEPPEEPKSEENLAPEGGGQPKEREPENGDGEDRGTFPAGTDGGPDCPSL